MLTAAVRDLQKAHPGAVARFMMPVNCSSATFGTDVQPGQFECPTVFGRRHFQVVCCLSPAFGKRSDRANLPPESGRVLSLHLSRRSDQPNSKHYEDTWNCHKGTFTECEFSTNYRNVDDTEIKKKVHNLNSAEREPSAKQKRAANSASISIVSFHRPLPNAALLNLVFYYWRRLMGAVDPRRDHSLDAGSIISRRV